LIRVCATRAFADTSAPTALLDRVLFGNAGSEQAHAVTGPSTAAGTGALGQTFRRITPAVNPITLHVKVDPAQQNYLTLQLWGSDANNIFFLQGTSPLTGVYGASDVPELDFVGDEAPFPGRFYYSTWAIPQTLTQGKAAVDLQIVAYAGVSPYAADVAARLPVLSAPSRGLYEAYIHGDPYFVPPADQPTGSAPAPLPSPAPTSNKSFAELKVTLDTSVQSLMKRQLYGAAWDSAVAAGSVPAEVMGMCLGGGADPTTARSAAAWKDFVANSATTGNCVPMNILALMAMLYQAPDSKLYHSAEVLARVSAGLDGYVRLQGTAGEFVSATWIGSPHATAAGGSPLEGFGVKGLARAYLLLAEPLAQSGVLEQLVDHDLDPATPKQARRVAWADMFVRARGFLLSAGRGHASNQDQAATTAAYLANEVIRSLDPARVSPTADLLAAVDEGFGLLPSPLGGYWITNKGLSLEPWGTLAGSYDGHYSYSPISLSTLAASATGDTQIHQRSLEIIHALAHFYLPDALAEPGDFQTIRREAAIGTRNNTYPGDIDIPFFFRAAVLAKDATAVRLLQLVRGRQQMPEVLPLSNAHVVDNLDDLVSARSYFDDVDALDPSAERLPMEASAPDAAWADEQGSVVAIKNRSERTFLSLNWRRGFKDGIRDAAHAQVNNVLRVHMTTPTVDRIVTATSMQSPEGFGKFYIARYGPYLIGMNLSASDSYALPIPAGSPARGADLIARRMLDLSQAVSVAPGSYRRPRTTTPVTFERAAAIVLQLSAT
jgi:hypothetical protein